MSDEAKIKVKAGSRLDELDAYLGDDLILTPIKTKSRYSKKWKIATREKGKKKVENVGYIQIKNTRPQKTIAIEPVDLGPLNSLFYSETLTMVLLVAAMRAANGGEYKTLDSKKYRLSIKF